MTHPSIDIYVCTGKGSSANPPANAGGIQLFHLSLSNGALTPADFVADPPNAGFLAVSPDGHHLYGLHGLREVNGQPGSGASAYAIEPQSGRLRLLNLQSVRGLWPSYIAFDSAGQGLIVTNYGTGNIAVLPIRDDGSLGEAVDVIQHQGSSVNPDRQEGPHAHSVIVDSTGQYALVADLGLDKIMIYSLEIAQGNLKLCAQGSFSTRPGSGPRHLAFHPNRYFLYCTNELDSTLTAFAWDASSGTLQEIETVSMLPAGFKGRNGPAHLQLAQTGNCLYASNRGHDSIVVYAVDPASGRLNLVSHVPTAGSSPRHFALDPTGNYLLVANEKSNNLVTFQIDAVTGDLLQIALTDVPNPAFILCRLR